MNPLAILYAPIKFIEEHVEKRFRFGVAFAIFACYVVLIAAAQIIVTNKLLDRLEHLPEEIRQWLSFIFLMTVLLPSVGSFFIWVISTGIISCVSILLDGKGDFKKLLELIGYCFLPLLVFSVLALVFALSYSPTLQYEALEGSSDEVIKEELRGPLQDELTSMRFRALAAVKGCFALWTGLLAVACVRRLEKLSLTKSVLAVLSLLVLMAATEVLKNTIIGS